MIFTELQRAELSDNLILLLSSNMQVGFGHQRLARHNFHAVKKGPFKLWYTQYFRSCH